MSGLIMFHPKTAPEEARLLTALVLIPILITKGPGGIDFLDAARVEDAANIAALLTQAVDERLIPEGEAHAD